MTLGRAFCVILLSVTPSAFAQSPALGGKHPSAVRLGTTHGIDLISIQRSVKPGDNFYLYANGNWIAHTTIPADRTSIGRFIYAQGDNPEAARLSGIALRPLMILEYALVAFLAWVAGMVWIGTTGSMQMAIAQGTMIFDVILVVVLGGISLVGGRGSVYSVVVGCILIGTLLNAFTIMDVNSEVQNIIRGIVLLAAILLDNRLHPRDEETARQGD